MSRKARKKGTRPSYEALGVSRERVRELKIQCRSGAFDLETLQLACNGDLEFLKKWLIVSVQKNLSYDDLETLWARGEIERPLCGRTDFYGYRRRFYSNLNMMLEERGEG